MTRGAGQVWRWYCYANRWHWDELWLLLSKPHSNDEAWDALNLETGAVDTIFPTQTTDWERVA